jgi:choline-sulfatase
MAPKAFFDLYPLDQIPLPQLRGPNDFPDHPVLKKLRDVQDYEDHFRDENHVRIAIAAYYGMVSFLDDNVGRIVQTLDAKGLGDDTLVIYTSDHGDNLGARTFWGKSNMYDESAGVPLIMCGPGVEAGKRVTTPVSLVDIYPTICATAGIRVDSDTRPGRSLKEIANGAESDRTVFSEYHAVASITGIFMVRFGRYKYVHYQGHRPQLFDLDADPFETRDLALEPHQEAVLAEGERRLRAICDPALVTERAFADQHAKIEASGGEEAVLGFGSFAYTPAPGEEP